MPERGKVFAVGELNAAIKGYLEAIPRLSALSVRGEISNWKLYRSGAFFDLKDPEGNVISASIWNASLARLPFPPKNGDQVICDGRLSVYTPKGRYSLIVQGMEKEGAGAYLLALEALKRKLAAEGLFDASKKRPLPRYPKVIGIVCGAQSAAESDLLRNIERRWPLAAIYDFRAQVQGEEAPKSLRNALRKAKKRPLDVLIIARGGGSREDLSAFDDEGLVRDLSAFPVPTISAVGHEIDWTLVDFVSDYRASTPTGAAEAATPDINEVLSSLTEMEGSLLTDIKKRLSDEAKRLYDLRSRPFFRRPDARFEELKNSLNDLKGRLGRALKGTVDGEARSLAGLKRALESLSPERVVERGYSLLEKEGGGLLTSVSDALPGERLKARLKDGTITVEVK